MTQEQAQATVHPINEAVGGPLKSKKLRPTKVLPTDRMILTKQLNLIRCYGVLSGQTKKPIRALEVAETVKMNADTARLANAFFIDVELLTKTDSGFIASTDVLNFAHAYEWHQETAAYKPAPTLERTWFDSVLLPRLKEEKVPVS